MKYYLNLIILFGCIALLETGEADNSIATISLDKVYNEYWKK